MFKDPTGTRFYSEDDLVGVTQKKNGLVPTDDPNIYVNSKGVGYTRQKMIASRVIRDNLVPVSKDLYNFAKVYGKTSENDLGLTVPEKYVPILAETEKRLADINQKGVSGAWGGVKNVARDIGDILAGIPTILGKTVVGEVKFVTASPVEKTAMQLRAASAAKELGQMVLKDLQTAITHPVSYAKAYPVAQALNVLPVAAVGAKGVRIAATSKNVKALADVGEKLNKLSSAVHSRDLKVAREISAELKADLRAINPSGIEEMVPALRKLHAAIPESPRSVIRESKKAKTAALAKLETLPLDQTLAQLAEVSKVKKDFASRMLKEQPHILLASYLDDSGLAAKRVSEVGYALDKLPEVPVLSTFKQIINRTGKTVDANRMLLSYKLLKEMGVEKPGAYLTEVMQNQARIMETFSKSSARKYIRKIEDLYSTALFAPKVSHPKPYIHSTYGMVLQELRTLKQPLMKSEALIELSYSRGTGKPGTGTLGIGIGSGGVFTKAPLAAVEELERAGVMRKTRVGAYKFVDEAPSRNIIGDPALVERVLDGANSMFKENVLLLRPAFLANNLMGNIAFALIEDPHMLTKVFKVADAPELVKSGTFSADLFGQTVFMGGFKEFIAELSKKPMATLIKDWKAMLNRGLGSLLYGTAGFALGGPVGGAGGIIGGFFMRDLISTGNQLVEQSFRSGAFFNELGKYPEAAKLLNKTGQTAEAMNKALITNNPDLYVTALQKVDEVFFDYSRLGADARKALTLVMPFWKFVQHSWTMFTRAAFIAPVRVALYKSLTAPMTRAETPRDTEVNINTIYELATSNDPERFKKIHELISDGPPTYLQELSPQLLSEKAIPVGPKKYGLEYKIRDYLTMAYGSPFGQQQELFLAFANSRVLSPENTLSILNNAGMGLGYGPMFGFLGMMTTGIDPLTKADAKNYIDNDYVWYPAGKKSWRISKAASAEMLRAALSGNGEKAQKIYLENVELKDTPQKFAPVVRSMLKYYVPSIERTLKLAPIPSIRPRASLIDIGQGAMVYSRFVDLIKKQTSRTPEAVEQLTRRIIAGEEDINSEDIRLLSEVFYTPSIHNLVREMAKKELGFTEQKLRTNFLKLFGTSISTVIDDPLATIKLLDRMNTPAAGEKKLTQTLAVMIAADMINLRTLTESDQGE